MSHLRARLTYANVAATLALVFAMTGGAYAASKFIITSTKQIKPSVLSQLKGKAGPAGPAGPGGPAGAKGENGAAGTNGTNGTNGKDGVSTTSKSFTGKRTLGSEKCEEGGTEVTSASGTTLVCNGTEGQQGQPGEPGAIHPGETLPTGASETGAWSYGALQATEENVKNGLPTTANVTVSFPVPLAKAIAHGAHLINEQGKEMIINESTFALEGVSQTACKGTAEAPTAEPGNFCMYIGNQSVMQVATTYAGSGATVASALIQSPGATAISGPPFDGSGSTGTTGAHLSVAVITGSSEGWGTWAVTEK